MTFKLPYWKKLQDPRWQKKRLEIFERDGFAYRDCHATDKTLQIHHCFYEKGEPWDTPDYFLLMLCEDCHPIRQSLEDDARRSLGGILSRVKVEFGCLDSFVQSLHHAANNQELFCPCVEEYGQIEYLAGGRWFDYAKEHPEFRSAYDEITDSKVDWKSVDQTGREREAERTCHA